MHVAGTKYIHDPAGFFSRRLCRAERFGSLKKHKIKGKNFKQ